MIKTITTSIIFILFISTFSYGQYTYSQPEEHEDGWETADLRLQEFDTARIYQLFNQLQQAEHKLHSVVVVKNNQILLEEYFNGQTIDQQHDLRSATKSIRSLLLGIAIDKGSFKVSTIQSPSTSKHLSQRKIWTSGSSKSPSDIC